jgi:hypothetical protein
MDALPIIIAYQKILDAWIEETLIAPWRNEIQNSKFKIQNSYFQKEASILEKDLQNILTKNYTLSIGRLYQILSFARDASVISSEAIAESRNPAPLTACLISYWQSEIPNTFRTLISDGCFVPFSDLIGLEVFSRKRHEGKVNYSDAEKIREVMVDASERKSLLEMIFSV